MSEVPSTPRVITGERAILARRYAGALYDLAAQENVLDAVAADLRGLSQLWDQCPEWRAIAADPRLAHEEATAAAAQVVARTEMTALTAKFVQAVAHNHRLSILPLIINDFFNRLAAHRGESRAEITAARPLSPSQHDALVAALSAASGGKVQLRVTQDDGILGGLKVKMGSVLIDASVKTRLDLLERHLIAGTIA